MSALGPKKVLMQALPMRNATIDARREEEVVVDGEEELLLQERKTLD